MKNTQAVAIILPLLAEPAAAQTVTVTEATVLGMIAEAHVLAKQCGYDTRANVADLERQISPEVRHAGQQT